MQKIDRYMKSRAFIKFITNKREIFEGLGEPQMAN